MDIKGFFKEKKWKQWKKDQWLIVFLAGVLLLVIAIPTGSNKNEENKKNEGIFSETIQQSEPATDNSYEDQLETRLEEILRSMEGVGQVQVMITLKDTGESVVEKDKESSYQTTSGTEGEGIQSTQQQTSETTVYENQTDEGGPFISKETTPEIEGVLVVAQGGNNAVTAQNISEAIQALFNIEVHKIKIVKMNIQEGTN